MQHPWQTLILSLANELDRAAIPYSFEASTSLLVQGLQTPEMDDVDISVQWDCLMAAHELFAKYSPSAIAYMDGWAKFQFERDGVPIDILSYEGTVMAIDADRVEVAWAGRRLWCKSLAFFHRNSPPGHPRRLLIERFCSERGSK